MSRGYTTAFLAYLQMYTESGGPLSADFNDPAPSIRYTVCLCVCTSFHRMRLPRLAVAVASSSTIITPLVVAFVPPAPLTAAAGCREALPGLRIQTQKLLAVASDVSGEGCRLPPNDETFGPGYLPATVSSPFGLHRGGSTHRRTQTDIFRFAC